MTSHRVEIGKIDVELGKNLPVVCLCPDPRDAAWDSRKFAGWDALIIGTQEHIPDVHRQYGKHFRRIDAIDEVDIHRAGRTVLKLRVYYATGLPRHISAALGMARPLSAGPRG